MSSSAKSVGSHPIWKNLPPQNSLDKAKQLIPLYQSTPVVLPVQPAEISPESGTKLARPGPAELDCLQNLGVERLDRPGWGPHLSVARLVSSLRRKMSCQVGCRGCVWSFFFLDLLKEWIVPVPVCAVLQTSVIQPTKAPPSESQQQSKLFGTGIFGLDLATCTQTQLCCSFFLPNAAPFKREMKWLSSSIRFTAKTHRYNRKIIHQMYLPDFLCSL